MSTRDAFPLAPAGPDQESADPPRELVAVGPEGTVVSWSWMPEPLEGQPLAGPFAWALIRLDGADTAMLHAVDAGSAAAMRTGLRVRPRWAASRTGSIRDIACFEPPTRRGPPRPDWARRARHRPGGTREPRTGRAGTREPCEPGEHQRDDHHAGAAAL